MLLQSGAGRAAGSTYSKALLSALSVETCLTLQLIYEEKNIAPYNECGGICNASIHILQKVSHQHMAHRTLRGSGRDCP